MLIVTIGKQNLTMIQSNKIRNFRLRRIQKKIFFSVK